MLARGSQRTLMLVAGILFGSFAVVAFVFRRQHVSDSTLSIVGGVMAYAFLALVVVVVWRGWWRARHQPGAAAARYVSRHPAVAEVVGTPVHVGPPEGDGPVGKGTAAQINLAVPVSGPEGEARVDLVMARIAREWEVLSGTLVAGGERVPLAAGPPEGAADDLDGEG
jgi:Cytochrome oxidase complex assembly protein 1